ncbi:MAG: hypothetical protein ACI4B9_03560 [Eggerthellaceae bacterium]
MNSDEQQSKAGLIFDIAFELILCFVVLIVAMLLSRNDIIGGPYAVDAALIAKIVIAVCLVVGLIVFISVKSTKDMDESMKQLQEEGFLGKGDQQ